MIKSSIATGLSRSCGAIILTLKNYKNIWRVFRGFLCLIIPVTEIFLVALLIDHIRAHSEFNSFWYSWANSMGDLMGATLIAVTYSIGLVYFLRFLHWLRTRGVDFWEKESAPHYQGEPEREPANARVNRPLSESKQKFVEWTTIAVFSSFSFFVLLIILTKFSNFGGVSTSAAQLNIEILREVIVQLPFFGDFIELGIFPSDSTLGNISYFVAIMPLSIAIRNLMFIFENIDQYKAAEDETLLNNIQLTSNIIIIGLTFGLTVFSILIGLDQSGMI